MESFVPMGSVVDSDISAYYAVSVFNEGDVIRKWRKTSGLNVEEVAARAGVDKNTITRAEANENTTTDSLRKIVAVLGHTLEELHATLSARDGLTSAEREHLLLWRGMSEEMREKVNGVVRVSYEIEQSRRTTAASVHTPEPAPQRGPTRTASKSAGPRKPKRR